MNLKPSNKLISYSQGGKFVETNSDILAEHGGPLLEHHSLQTFLILLFCLVSVR